MTSSQEFRREIEDLSVSGSELAFWWLGQHSWILKTTGHIIGLDLFLKPDDRRLVPAVLRADDCDFFDFVLCTHEHSDHFDRPTLATIAQLGSETRFVVPKVLRGPCADIALPADRTILLDGRDEYRQDDLTISSIPAAHEFLEFDQTEGYRYLGYIITVDGLRVYHSGDTCYYDGLAERLRRQRIDLAFVPINGRDAVRYRANRLGNMTYQEAVDLVGAFAPSLACPAHYGMFAHNTEDPAMFADYLAAKFPHQQCRICQPHKLQWFSR